MLKTQSEKGFFIYLPSLRYADVAVREGERGMFGPVMTTTGALSGVMSRSNKFGLSTATAANLIHQIAENKDFDITPEERNTLLKLSDGILDRLR